MEHDPAATPEPFWRFGIVHLFAATFSIAVALAVLRLLPSHLQLPYVGLVIAGVYLSTIAWTTEPLVRYAIAFPFVLLIPSLIMLRGAPPATVNDGWAGFLPCLIPGTAAALLFGSFAAVYRGYLLGLLGVPVFA